MNTQNQIRASKFDFRFAFLQISQQPNRARLKFRSTFVIDILDGDEGILLLGLCQPRLRSRARVFTGNILDGNGGILLLGLCQARLGSRAGVFAGRVVLGREEPESGPSQGGERGEGRTRVWVPEKIASVESDISEQSALHDDSHSFFLFLVLCL
jgi:hypothetical protein